MSRGFKYIIAVFFLFFNAIKILFAQASTTEFGQNRVQYRTFEWHYYDSTHFRSFYYDNGKPIAQYVLKIAEQDLPSILYIMGGRLTKKLNLIIYNSFGEYKQTNLGRQNEEINKANGGYVEVVGDNIPLYFTGNHEDLKKQIRKGISKVIKDNMLFGDKLKEIVKNAIKMNLPEWYTVGYVAYTSSDWTAQNTTDLNNLLSIQKKINFTPLAFKYPEIVGQSFWNFIAQKYGENYVSNLLHLTRYRKTVNHSIELIFNKPASEIFDEWKTFYLQNAQANNPQLDTLIKSKTLLTKIKVDNEATYSQFSISPKQNEIAYVKKKEGKYEVLLRDTRNEKKEYLIVDGGLRASTEIKDPDYPMIAWSPNARKLAILYEQKNIVRLRIYTSGKRKLETRVLPPNKFDRITGMCFMGDDNTLVFTAIKKGKSDLFKYTYKSKKIIQVTNDLFDDMQPAFIANGEQNGILFLSNRTTPFIGENAKSDIFSSHFNLYLYQENKGTNLIQLSNTNAIITQPIQYFSNKMSYLVNQNAMQQRMIITPVKRAEQHDTFETQISSTLYPDLITQTYSHTNAALSEVIKKEGYYFIYNTPISKIEQYENAHPIQLLNDTVAQTTNNEKYEADNHYTSEYTDTSSLLENIFNPRKKNTSLTFISTLSNVPYNTKSKNYRPSFYPDFVQTTLDNTILFNRYQPFDYYGGQFQFPPLGGFITLSLNDVLEDYKITGGVKIPVNFNGLSYFLQFANFRKRTDWNILYYHAANTNAYDQRDAPPPYFSPYAVTAKTSTDYVQSTWAYPFDVVKSIKLQLGIRYDALHFHARDHYSIAIPDDKQCWAVSRMEFVYDNSHSPILNIWKGTRAKLFAEYQYKLTSPSKGFYNFGYDARHYLTLYKNIILASRIAGAHSGGNAKILYFLGGVDNPLISQFETNTNIDYSQHYAFQTTATNLRGYKTNARNGNSYMVINEEVRLPIYNTFINRSTKSGFLKNLQLVAFTDIGSAWRGILPDAENIKSSSSIIQYPVFVTIDKEENSLGWGYGLGLRSTLLGYFFRVDAAWNIEGNPKPLWHISMATDF